jgi:hypothetical protein
MCVGADLGDDHGGGRAVVMLFGGPRPDGRTSEEEIGGRNVIDGAGGAGFRARLEKPEDAGLTQRHHGV